MATVLSHTETTTVLEDKKTFLEDEKSLPKLIAPQAEERQYQIKYFNALIFGYFHLITPYGIYLAWTVATWKTLFFQYFLYVIAMIGVTAGAHRLWSHRSYKAKMPLQILLMVMNTFALQSTATYWAQEHRLHHRYSDTDADPHNASRGFFFSHIGWLLVKKHPEVKRRGKFIDMSDIYANPVLRFQKKYALPFITSVCLILPTVIPMYFFGETFNTAWNINLTRCVLNLHGIFLLNSAGHKWGTKPYDKNIKPTQNLTVTFATCGEGFHNYHHTYPWDYRASELGNNWLNLSTKFIDFFAWIGWAYDLKTVSQNITDLRMSRTGDKNNTWGI